MMKLLIHQGFTSVILNCANHLNFAVETTHQIPVLDLSASE